MRVQNIQLIRAHCHGMQIIHGLPLFRHAEEGLLIVTWDTSALLMSMKIPSQIRSLIVAWDAGASSLMSMKTPQNTG